MPDLAGIGLTLSGAPLSTAGTPFTLTVTAQDLLNPSVVAASYQGTVSFSSTDVLAGLPSNYTFTAADQGSHTFFVTLTTLGIQSVTVTDTINAEITGTQVTSVTAVPTSLLLTSSATTAPPDDPITFTATVTNTVATTLAPPTGGTVTFAIDGQVQAIVPLVNGIAVFTTTSLGLGTHNVSATYDGTSTFLASSAALMQVVNGLPATILTSAGASGNGASQVTLYDATGKPTASFYVFDPVNFHGGVTVARADINGDGVLDVIVGAGAGGGPQVEVLDGTKLSQVQSNGQIAPSAILASFYAFNPGFGGGLFVAAANTASGKPLIVVGADAGGGPQVEVIDGTKLSQLQSNGQIATSALLGSFYAFDPSFGGGVRVAIGDINRDGTLDVIVGAGPGSAPQVSVVDGTKLSQLQSNGQIANGASLASFYAYDSRFAGGVFVAVGITRGGSQLNVVVGPAPGASLQVEEFDGSKLNQLQSGGVIASSALLSHFYALPQFFLGGERVATADVNQDGKADIVVAAGPGAGPQVTTFDAVTGNILSSFFATVPSYQGGVFV